MDAKIREIERKANMALAIAKAAQSAQSEHEIECSIRYRELSVALDPLPEMKIAIDAIMKFVKDARVVAKFFHGCGRFMWKAGKTVLLWSAVIFALYRLYHFFTTGTLL